jgi:hypothetical protein
VPVQQTTDLVEKRRAQKVVFEELIFPDEIHDLLRSLPPRKHPTAVSFKIHALRNLIEHCYNLIPVRMSWIVLYKFQRAEDGGALLPGSELGRKAEG